MLWRAGPAHESEIDEEAPGFSPIEAEIFLNTLCTRDIVIDIYFEALER